MRNSTRGYYTLEAAILLPLVLIMILSLGWFTRACGSWENCFHCAADESAVCASMSIDGVSGYTAPLRISRRINKDVSGLQAFSVSRFRYGYTDGTTDELTSFRLNADSSLHLPAGFSRLLRFSAGIRYRGFTGKSYEGDPLGTAGLEEGLPEDPVWIFPLSGEKYHDRNCTFVRASVHSCALTATIRSTHSACSACMSAELPAGSIVYCFEGEDTAYHRGTCRTILRHTAVIDRTEAIQKGYTPCSKCGGGS